MTSNTGAKESEATTTTGTNSSAASIAEDSSTQAASIAAIATPPETTPVVLATGPSDCAYSKVGLAMWLNNQPDLAEEHFRARLHSTPIFAGYTFIVSMNGVIAYEMDRIEQAQRLLKDLERRCQYAQTPAATPSPGWFSSFRSRLFGTPSTPLSTLTPLASIEEQIILADTFLSSAILTFLTQDITGLMRGSWLLRKAWKIYQSTYGQLYEMFLQQYGDQYHMPPMPSTYRKSMQRSKSEYHVATNAPGFSQPITSSHQQIFPATTDQTVSPHLYSQPFLDALSTKSPSIVTTPDPAEALSKPCDPNRSDILLGPAKPDRPTHLALSYTTNMSSPVGDRQSSIPQTCPTEQASTSFGSQPQTRGRRVRKVPDSCSSLVSSDISRLMGAVSFGYGIFQLSASLLPLSLLRIISFFGFEGNRERGIECLMYARLSDDMRAPLATLALLWFYTFGSQMLKYEDGYTASQALAAANLITESQLHYPNSAIFLFFRGRVERMQANSLAAVQAYQRAFQHSAQKELRLLCLHEIAWCKLIQLDFDGAQQRFNELREVSVFSKAFYTYMTAICQGAAGQYAQLAGFRTEISALLVRSKQRDLHIGAFVQHRIQLFPDESSGNRAALEEPNLFYWRYLVYEVLFLWSALSSASVPELTCIVSDCSAPAGKFIEPMAGIQQLIMGGALAALKQYQAAVNAYRLSISQRAAESVADDYHHVAAYAHYELAMLLLQCSSDCTQEAKELLRNALTYRGYDLENRLVVHVQKELRKLG